MPAADMPIISALKAAGHSDPGLQREVNEDRFHVDLVRSVFMVIDGVGGQAAGGKAADTALALLRTRLERETGPTAERVREAISIANNEIHRLASVRPEWNGMACVLTVAVVESGRAIVGHVGDTRLYKLRNDTIEKVTRDHSPIGEREDSNEISELDAMRHPRRNEVYRDVGSERHEPDDPDFIDVHEIPFEPDAALLLCSDGLSDLISSASVTEIVGQFAGQPEQVVRALVKAANDAGGKDNITVVYVEGDQFATMQKAGHAESASRPSRVRETAPTSRRRVRIALLVLLMIVIGAALSRSPLVPPLTTPSITRLWPFPSFTTRTPQSVVVRSTESIAAALERVSPGSTIVVDPGEYRERILMKSGVRLVSRVPRGATIRLPSTASEAEAAVVASGISGAELAGFRIIGDAATPLGTGLSVQAAALSIVDVEISGALNAAVDFAQRSRASLIASDIHDNPGAALSIRSGALPRIAHNVFMRNGLSERAPSSLMIETGTEPRFSGNVFHGIGPAALIGLDERLRAAVMRDNWFVSVPESTPSFPSARPGRQGRQGRQGR